MSKATARVSARTTHIEFDQKYGTKYCIESWLRDEQVRIAMQKVKGRITASETTRPEPIAVVGFGPSLKTTWEKVRDFKFIISCSGAHRFLLERGIIPTWHVEVDPRAHKVDLLGEPHKDVIYLPSSTSHPKYLDHILASGADVQLWHVFSHEKEATRLLPPGEWALTGGADAGLRSLVMARVFGFIDIHAFGIDGCAGDESESHAAAHPKSPGKFFPCEYPKDSGKFYKTTPALLACAKSVPREVGQLKDATVTFHGDGLVQAIMREQKPSKPAAYADIAFAKPELISGDYLKLNRQLHSDNPAYGTSGSKYVDTVLRLAKSIGTTSILDYGCGKGLLAKGIPFPIWEYDPAIEGKTESPRPADLVVCTDVLEHIEPEHLDAVLADIARCTAKVGYLVISTRQAAKTLADGRNAHLIQQKMPWWEKKLSKFFSIAKIFEASDELQVVVSPKVANKPRVGSDMVMSVSHDGTDAKFNIVNQATKWRAETLFTKEPATIEWIDTFEEGDSFYDVGANIGGYSVWAARRRGVKVTAFEPQALNYALLCRNLSLNAIDGAAYCMALANETKFSKLYLSTNDAGGSCNTFGEKLGPDLKAREGIPQGCIGYRLDDFGGNPDHIKIDVDGLEHLVIAGGMQTIARAKSLMVEVNTNLPEHMQMVETLTGMGFKHDPEKAKAALRKEGAFVGCGEYVFYRTMPDTSVEDYVLKAIADSPMLSEPYPHLYVRDVFPQAFYEELLASLPAEGYKSLEEARGTKGYPQRFVHEAPKSLRWMRSGKLRALLNERFGVSATSDETLLIRDRPGYAINPHTDTPSKAVSALFYMPSAWTKKEHGTSIYVPIIKAFKDAQGAHHERKGFSEVWRASGKPNTAFIFARTDSSFHGAEKYKGNAARDILLYDSRK